MAKKKNIKVGTINGLDVLKQTRPPQDIPFRTGSYTDKRKKREKINKNRLDKWLQIVYNITIKKEGEKEMNDNQLNLIIRLTDLVIETIEDTNPSEKERREMIKYLINELFNRLFDE